MKNMKRALRRHHAERIKRNFYKELKQWEYYHTDPEEHEQWMRTYASRRVNTSSMCSCWMCGNPRKYFGHLTLQEERHLLSFDEEVRECSLTDKATTS